MSAADAITLQRQVDEVRRLWRVIDEALPLTSPTSEVMIAQAVELAEQRTAETIEALRQRCGTRALAILHDAGLTTGSRAPLE